MLQKERLDQILKIITRYKYVTVQFLTEELHYSTATINRDLNRLAEQKLIVRHYGGAEIAEGGGIPIRFRQHKMRVAKNKLGKAAAELVCDGDTVFIDATTTTQCMAQYLTEKHDITVISNNMALIAFLSEYGIKTVCLGGEICEAPSFICSYETVLQAQGYKADKFFFSAAGVSKNGEILDGENYFLLRKAMKENSETVYFLVDHDKYSKEKGKRISGNLGQLTAVISDFEFPKETRDRYLGTEFITVK